MANHFQKVTAIAALIVVLVTATVGCGGKVNPPAGSDSSATSSTGSNQTDDTSADGSTDTTDPNASGSSDASGTDSTTGSNAGSTPGGTNSNGQTQGGGTQSTNQGSGSSTNGFKEPVMDLKNRVITIGTESVPDMSKNSIFTESIKLTQEKYNCTFKFFKKEYVALYQALINGHAAGSAPFDVINLRGYDVFPNAGNSGAVLDVNQYYDFAKDPTWQVDFFKTTGVFKGKRYGIPYTPNEVGNGIWYRRDLLRKFNVPDLWTYVNNDTWNWQTFRAVCKKLTQDTDGDGKPDYWGFTSSDPWLEFVHANNGALLTSGVNGAPRIGLDSKNSLEAIQFIADLHMIDNTVPDGKELGAITNSPFNAMFTGKVAMYPYHARYGAALQDQGVPAKDIGWVYFPKGPGAKSYVTSTGTMPDMFLVAMDIKNPKEVVVALQDMCAYWDTSRKVKRKVEDKTEELYGWLKSSIDSNAKKVLMHQAKYPVFTLANNYNLSQTLQNELWPMILKGKSVKTSVDSLKTKMQKEVTDKYNGTVVGK